MRIESKIEDLYINQVIKLRDHLSKRKPELLDGMGRVWEDKIDQYKELMKNIVVLDEYILSETTRLIKNSPTLNPDL